MSAYLSGWWMMHVSIFGGLSSKYPNPRVSSRLFCLPSFLSFFLSCFPSSLPRLGGSYRSTRFTSDHQRSQPSTNHSLFLRLVAEVFYTWTGYVYNVIGWCLGFLAKQTLITKENASSLHFLDHQSNFLSFTTYLITLYSTVSSTDLALRWF